MTMALAPASTIAMSDTPSEIGVRVKAAREYAGLSQSALSMGMSPSPGRAWCGLVESGNIQQPAVVTLQAAAELTGVAFEWLATGKGEMVAAEVEGTA